MRRAAELQTRIDDLKGKLKRRNREDRETRDELRRAEQELTLELGEVFFTIEWVVREDDPDGGKPRTHIEVYGVRTGQPTRVRGLTFTLQMDAFEVVLEHVGDVFTLPLLETMPINFTWFEREYASMTFYQIRRYASRESAEQYCRERIDEIGTNSTKCA